MKKLGILISLLLVLGIVLAACSSGQQNGNATQGPTGLGAGEIGAGTETVRETGVPYGGGQGTEVPGTGLSTSTSAATSAVSGVATKAATSPATSAPRATSTTASGTGTGKTTGTPGAVLPGTGRAQAALLTELLDLHVRNNNGDDLGKVDNMVIDLGQQQGQYVVLASGGFLGIGEKLILIPWDAMTVTWNGKGNDQNAFILNLDKATIQNAPNFSTSQLPDVSTPGWDANLRTFWALYLRTGTGGTSNGTGTGSNAGTPNAGSGTGASATGTPGASTGGTGQATRPAATSAAGGIGPGASATAAAGTGTGTASGMNRLVMAKDLLDYQIVGFASATGGSGAGSTTVGTGTPGASTGGTGQTTRPAATSAGSAVGTAMAPGVSTATASGAAESLGSVKDALVDVQNGKVTYLVIAANASLG